jgi:hypothetical protein
MVINPDHVTCGRAEWWGQAMMNRKLVIDDAMVGRTKHAV